MSTLVDLKHISKSFDGEMVLDDLNLTVPENSFVTLLGPSGCGKTTTLRILGGFTTPDSGKVIFDGQDITSLPPNRRQLNTVFQKYALILHHDGGDDVGVTDKVRDEGVFRLVVNLLRRAHLLDIALVHDDDGVGHGEGLFLVVGHVDKGDAELFFQAYQLVLHVLAEL